MHKTRGVRMAIYHLTVKTCTRAKGQSAAAKCAYITRSGKYVRERAEVVDTWAGNMPAWAADPSTYWRAADEYERANARLCKTVEVSLPLELDADQRREAAEQLIQWIVSTKLPYTAAIHRGEGGLQPHLHVTVSERMTDEHDRGPEGHFRRASNENPAQGGARKTERLKPQAWLETLRQEWAQICNTCLEKAGETARIDHRTLEEQAGGPKPTPEERRRKKPTTKTWAEAKAEAWRREEEVHARAAAMHREAAIGWELELDGLKAQIRAEVERKARETAQKEAVERQKEQEAARARSEVEERQREAFQDAIRRVEERQTPTPAPPMGVWLKPGM